jgi:hypothetical protein
MIIVKSSKNSINSYLSTYQKDNAMKTFQMFLDDYDLNERTLTDAELKKREEIAKAIERENPDIPMDQKMAIATAAAKKAVKKEKSEEEKEKESK